MLLKLKEGPVYCLLCLTTMSLAYRVPIEQTNIATAKQLNSYKVLIARINISELRT